jgi:hypothetical protein
MIKRSGRGRLLYLKSEVSSDPNDISNAPSRHLFFDKFDGWEVARYQLENVSERHHHSEGLTPEVCCK